MKLPRFLRKSHSIKDIIRYMEERYQENFTYHSSGTESYISGNAEIWLKTAKFPGEYILVLRNKDTNELTDNYLAYVLTEEIRREIQRVASQVYGECFVLYVQPRTIRPPLEPGIDERVFLRSNGTHASAGIVVKTAPEQKQEDLDKFVAVLKEERYCLRFALIYVNPAVFHEVNEETYEKYADPFNPDMLSRGSFTFVWPELSYADWTDEHLRYAKYRKRRQP